MQSKELYELADSDDSDPDIAYVFLPGVSDDEDEMPLPWKKLKSQKHKKNKIWSTNTCFLCYIDTILFACNS